MEFYRDLEFSRSLENFPEIWIEMWNFPEMWNFSEIWNFREIWNFPWKKYSNLMIPRP
jgi:hypothetical protein